MLNPASFPLASEEFLAKSDRFRVSNNPSSTRRMAAIFKSIVPEPESFRGRLLSRERIEQEQIEKKSLFQSPFPLFAPVQIGAARGFGHAFLPLQQIRPVIETIPLAPKAFGAAEAYGRMMRNEAPFRIILVAGQ